MIYANCGCYLGPGEVKGSMRHPCCTECFTKVWEDDEEEERMKVVYFNRHPEYFTVNDDGVSYHDVEYDYNSNESEIVRHFVEGFLKKRGLWEKLF